MRHGDEDDELEPDDGVLIEYDEEDEDEEAEDEEDECS